MRLSNITAIATLLVWGCTSAVPAADRGDGPDANEARPAGRPPGAGPPGFSPPRLRLQDTLDTDRNGKLSEAEIRAAAVSLKKLDKNEDGVLSAEEIDWPPRFARSGPGGGRRDPFGGPPGSERASGVRSFAERLLARDANRDGKIVPDELPKSMHWLIQLGDQNKDGALDDKEARALAERMGLAAGRVDSQ